MNQISKSKKQQHYKTNTEIELVIDLGLLGIREMPLHLNEDIGIRPHARKVFRQPLIGMIPDLPIDEVDLKNGSDLEDKSTTYC